MVVTIVKTEIREGLKTLKERMIGDMCIGHVGVKDKGGGGDYSKDIH